MWPIRLTIGFFISWPVMASPSLLVAVVSAATAETEDRLLKRDSAPRMQSRRTVLPVLCLSRTRQQDYLGRPVGRSRLMEELFIFQIRAITGYAGSTRTVPSRRLLELAKLRLQMACRVVSMTRFPQPVSSAMAGMQGKRY